MSSPILMMLSLMMLSIVLNNDFSLKLLIIVNAEI